MESVFLFFVMVLMFALIGGIVFKYRADIRRWLHDPKYGTTWQPDRKVILQRRIEDAKAEMEWIDTSEESEKLAG